MIPVSAGLAKPGLILRHGRRSWFSFSGNSVNKVLVWLGHTGDGGYAFQDAASHFGWINHAVHDLNIIKIRKGDSQAGLR
jgi:hypothetical protein